MQTFETTELPDRATRHDGWTPERVALFLDSLAAKGNVRLACRRAGMSPEAAYRCKRRDPAFARGWAAALVLANDNGLDTLADRAIDGVEEDVWHRGELVGTRRRYDSRLLLAHLARLEKAAADKTAQADAARFDELVACIVGETVPGMLADDDPLLPVDREGAAQRAGEQADQDAEDAGGSHDDCVEAYRAGLREGEARWDEWVEEACCYVDRLTGWNAEPPPPEPLTQVLAEAARQPCESPAKSFAWTLSESSTSALACSLAGPQGTAEATPGSPREGRGAAMR